MFRVKYSAYIAFLAGTFLLSACAGHEGLKSDMVKSIDSPYSAIVDKISVAAPTVPPDTVPLSTDYQIGVGDIVSIQVYGRPDLSTVKSRVDGKGDIHLPLTGTVHVEGLAVGEIRHAVETSLRRYLQDPSVVVEVTDYRSRPIYLLGQFKLAGTHYMERPMNLLQGLALGGGFDSTANLRGVRLLRDKKIAPVDIYALIMNGRIDQNVWLRPGDTVYIPDNHNLSVFVFGSVNKPGPIPMPNGRLNLLEAMSIADPRNIGTDIDNVRIIRSLTTTTGELLVVDLGRIRRGEVMPLELMEGDIVYVPKNRFGTWNDAINELLPTLTAISTALSPYIAITYLLK